MASETIVKFIISNSESVRTFDVLSIPNFDTRRTKVTFSGRGVVVSVSPLSKPHFPGWVANGHRVNVLYAVEVDGTVHSHEDYDLRIKLISRGF